MEKPEFALSTVVQEHLHKLCLQDFPCGIGSWNRSRFLPKKRRAWRELTPRKDEMLSPEEEPVDALLGLACSPHSPWLLPEEASAEDRFLRELAIRHPQMINETFFYSYFRSLRVVDKRVSHVDKNILKHQKLEELLLSANPIKELDALHLPATLKVLELYGNEIASMECLCAHPPPQLQHLGLGHNKLQGPLENLYVTSDYWPNLVSLDLSFNNLTDLQGLVASLSTLKCLRLLVLQGNPLALVPYYRGFIVDSLPHLCVLDDITVSPSEKHLFRGLGYNGDLLSSEAQLVVTIGNVTGVLDSSVFDPEPGPQGPFITYSYYVTYDFVEDEDNEKKEYGGVLAEIVKPLSVEELPAVDEAPEEAPVTVAPSAASLDMSQSQSQDTMAVDSVMSTMSAGFQRTESVQELVKLRPRIDPRLFPSPGTVLFSTVRKPWMEVIPCSYEMHHTLKGLVSLKAFLLAGTTVTVVEEKILSWPVGQSPVDHPVVAKKGKDKEEKDKGKSKKEKEPPKERKASKKKDAPKELRQDPPILQVLGSGLVLLEPLLAGESLVSTVCNLGVVRTADSDRLTFLRDSKKTKSKKNQKERKKSLTVTFDSAYQPEPLTVEFQVQLNQCRTAEEALRDFAVHGLY